MPVELLTNGTRVHTCAPHTFGTDAMLLAQFCAPRPQASICDFGTGCGILPLALHDAGHLGTCVGVELQPEAAALLEASLADNAITHITAVCADLRTWRAPQRFDLALCNPPYFTDGLQSPNPARAQMRHALTCTLAEVCAAAYAALKPRGRFVLCYKPEALTDALCTLRAARLEPKRLRLVQHTAAKAPWLVLIEARRECAMGLRTEPVLIMENRL